MSDALAAYLVKGDDPVLVAEAVQKLVGELVGDGDAGLMVEDLIGEEYEVAAVVDAAQTPPFLSDRRVVVARSISRFTTEELQPLLDYLTVPLDTTNLVLAAGGGRLSTSLTNAVKKVGHVVDAGVGTRPKDREAWVAARAKDAAVTLDRGALALVGTHLGEDVGRLGGLLRLLEAAYGEGARVTAEQLEPFLGDAGAVAPWDLTDAIDSGDPAGALGALERLLVGGDRHPLQILATLHTHYARMLRLDGADITDEATAAAALGLKGSTFPARKAMQQARKLGHEGIARAIELLAGADLDLKGQRAMPDRLVMEILVARLSRLAPKGAARAGSR